MTDFAKKNSNRKAARSKWGGQDAKWLRKFVPIIRKGKETIETPFGEAMEQDVEIVSVPGAFGWASKDDWNERVVGTTGEER